jgi:hypothetical protein
MRSFFTGAFYLLQELAGVVRLTSLLQQQATQWWFGITSPLIKLLEKAFG